MRRFIVLSSSRWPLLASVLACITLLSVALAGQARAEDPIDGTYHGTYSNSGQKCNGGGPTTMTIHEHVVNRNFGPSIKLTATVGADGKFTTQYGQTNMTGIARNGHVELDIASPWCTTHQVMDRG